MLLHTEASTLWHLMKCHAPQTYLKFENGLILEAASTVLCNGRLVQSPGQKFVLLGCFVANILSSCVFLGDLGSTALKCSERMLVASA